MRNELVLGDELLIDVTQLGPLGPFLFPNPFFPHASKIVSRIWRGDAPRVFDPGRFGHGTGFAAAEPDCESADGTEQSGGISFL